MNLKILENNNQLNKLIKSQNKYKIENNQMKNWNLQVLLDNQILPKTAMA